MEHFDKAAVGSGKSLMQLGTLSGNPIAAAAGLKTMEVLRRDGAYDELRRIGSRLQDMQSDALTAAGIPQRICGDETLFDLYFTEQACTNYRNAHHDDLARNEAYNATLREHGILKSPAKLYPSLAVTEDDLELSAEAIAHAVASITE